MIRSFGVPSEAVRIDCVTQVSSNDPTSSRGAAAGWAAFGHDVAERAAAKFCGHSRLRAGVPGCDGHSRIVSI
jgi:hypothetical protein